MPEFYQKSVKQIAADLSVDLKTGLSDAEAKKRIDTYGRNTIESGKKINPFKLFLSQFNDVLVIVLIIAALVSFGLSFANTSETETPEGFQPPTAAQEEEASGQLAICQCLAISCGELCDEIAAGTKELFCRSDAVDDCDFVEVEQAHDEGPTESLLIFGIVIAIAVIGFFNEYKAERTVEALKKLVGHSARVRRDGKEEEVPADELVPGDIVLLEEGQKIPADIRLYQVKNLDVNEASLTGESVPVNKNTFAIDKKSAVGDQKNMAFSGTIVSTGTAEGIVVATGINTEIGKIANLVDQVEEELTPMQRKLDDLGRRLGAIILAISLFVFVVIFFLDNDLQDEDTVQRLILAFTAAVALAVAAIPEGLAFVVRISLALGARRMAAKDALVRKLSAVEALGSTDVVCSDKTGTLTRGEMTVREMYYNGKRFEVTGSGYETRGDFTENGKEVDVKSVSAILRVGALVNNAQVKEGTVLGDPTEGALIVSAAKAGLMQQSLKERYPRSDEVPFTSDRKMMSTVHKMSSGYLVASKGAVDVLLNKCDRIVKNGKTVKLTADMKKKVLAENSRMAGNALRVLAMAYKETKTKPSGEKDIESKLVFLGLQGMMDPPRTEVREVIKRVQTEAGMRVLMITGDHIQTAKAVAAEIGIQGEAIEGTELDELSQEEFEERVEHISVYARVNPEHKIRIVQALKKHGHQVAMTGDGVNDAPAIKAADIGVAMGITGTDAAKEASDLILLDDQFLTIIDAIEEGRGIFDNVRKFVNYLLSANIAEVIAILGGVLFLGRLILTAAQLLFINIVTDGLPAVALGSDPAEKGIMRFKPIRFQGSIITKRVWLEMVIFGLLMSLILLIHFWYILEQADDVTRAVSVAFASMVIYEMVRLVGIRTDYKIKWFSNPWLSVAMVGSLSLLLGVLYIPSFAEVFEVGPILGIDWAIIAIGSLFLLVIMKIIDIILDRMIPDVSAPAIIHKAK